MFRFTMCYESWEDSTLEIKQASNLLAVHLRAQQQSENPGQQQAASDLARNLTTMDEVEEGEDDVGDDEEEGGGRGRGGVKHGEMER